MKKKTSKTTKKQSDGSKFVSAVAALVVLVLAVFGICHLAFEPNPAELVGKCYLNDSYVAKIKRVEMHPEKRYVLEYTAYHRAPSLQSVSSLYSDAPLYIPSSESPTTVGRYDSTFWIMYKNEDTYCLAYDLAVLTYSVRKLEMELHNIKLLLSDKAKKSK